MFQFKEINESIFKGKGYSGIGIFNGKTEINMGLLLRSAAIWGNDFIFTIGKRYKAQKSDTTKSHLHVPTFSFETFEQFKSVIHPNVSIVAIEMGEKAKWIHEFNHPERAVYLLGAEDSGIPESILKQCNHVVKIAGEISLNVGVAGSIVLHDRFVKRFNNKNNNQ